MKVTVITVVRNAVQSIADTLASVAGQSHPRVEHVIVDGASSDGTLEVIEREGAHIARLVSEPDRGIYDAMNKGLRLATGDVIGFLNADDVFVDQGVLQRIASAMAADGLDALFGDIEFMDPANPGLARRRYRSGRFSPRRIAWGWMPAHPALYLTRETYACYGPYRTDYQIAGDFEMVARVFRDGALRYRYLPEVLVRMRTGGISTAGWRNTVLLNREVLRACRENGIDTNLFKILSKYPRKLFEFRRS